MPPVALELAGDSVNCVVVSDTHLHEAKTPPADLLLHGGDMSMRGSLAEMRLFAQWLVKQPQKFKVWIAGNHEMGVEADEEMAIRIAKETDSIYLNDSEVCLDGVRIWGSPITPWFFDWAYNRQRGLEIREYWLKIPEGIDILVTHGPPYGHLDLTKSGEHVGCEELLDVLCHHLKRPPRFHLFGHIHEGYGREQLTRPDGATIELINASTCDARYQPVNPPVEFVCPAD